MPKYVIESTMNVFAYKTDRRTTLGHEKEVLFASGVKLKLRNRRLVQSSFRVPKVNRKTGLDSKEIPIHVLEIDVTGGFNS